MVSEGVDTVEGAPFDARLELSTTGACPSCGRCECSRAAEREWLDEATSARSEAELIAWLWKLGAQAGCVLCIVSVMWLLTFDLSIRLRITRLALNRSRVVIRLCMCTPRLALHA